MADPVEVADAVQVSSRRVPVSVEFVQVPAQPVDHPGAFGQEVFAVVDEEADVAVVPIQVGYGEVVFAQGGAGSGQGVDWVGLP